MKPWIRYTLLAGVAYIVFLVVMFPADRGYGMIQGPLRAAGVPVKLYGIEGTLWHGEADGAMIAGRPIQSLHWAIHPTALLTGSMEAKIGLRDANSRADAVVGRSLGGDLYLKDLAAHLSMADLVTALNLPAFKLDGQLRANLADLRLDGGTITEATGTLGWYGAATQFPQRLTLGDLTAKLETTDAGVKAVLDDGGGPLDLSGELLLKPDGQYQLKATFAARDGQQSPLARSLRMMGRPDASGKVTVSQNGKLSDFGFFLK